MNYKRFLAAASVLFIFICIYETLVHGFLLTSLYNTTPLVWRNQQQMMAYIPFNIAIMILL